MGENLEDLWKERIANQKFELIGTTVPQEGNGYHDRISPSLHYHLLQERNDTRWGSWLYSVYFRDLGLYLNPDYSENKEQLKKDFFVDNASDDFKKTFFRYLNKYEPPSRINLLKIIGDWGSQLVQKGGLIYEFVNWFDNDSGEFYAYELKMLELNFCRNAGDYIIYEPPQEVIDGQTEIRTFNIPKAKCILIGWPMDYGGYKNYLSTVENALKLGDIHDHFSNVMEGKPGEIIKSHEKWNIDFEHTLQQWGTNKANDRTTEYFKIWSWFKYKRTIIYCTQSIILGFEQIIEILNIQLGENAIFKCTSSKYDVQLFKLTFEKWEKGELSIEEALAYLTIM